MAKSEDKKRLQREAWRKTLVVVLDNLDDMRQDSNRLPCAIDFINAQGWSSLGFMAHGPTWYHDGAALDFVDKLVKEISLTAWPSMVPRWRVMRRRPFRWPVRARPYRQSTSRPRWTGTARAGIIGVNGTACLTDLRQLLRNRHDSKIYQKNVLIYLEDNGKHALLIRYCRAVLNRRPAPHFRHAMNRSLQALGKDPE